MKIEIFLKDNCSSCPDELYFKIYDKDSLKYLIDNMTFRSREGFLESINSKIYSLLENGEVILNIYINRNRDCVLYATHSLPNDLKKLNINFNHFLDIIDIHSEELPCDGITKVKSMLSNNFWAKYCCSETTKEKTVKEEKIQNKNERGFNMKTNNFFGNIMGNLQFGRMETDEIKYSFKGISYKTDNGDYVCYDSSTEELTNVNQMVFDMPIMVMPIPKKDLNIGDVIKHNDKFVIVKKINEKNIEAIKPNEQELVTIIPMKSIFGFDFYSKVVNFLEGLDTDANQDNPFGKAMLPMLMMGENKDNNMNNILPLMMMNGGDSSINSLLPMLMMGGEDTGNTNNMLPLMMMMQMNKK